jgi:hypothetical protein
VFDEVTAAIVTGAAGNVVAYMVSGHVDALRARLAKIFHQDAGDQRGQVLRAVEEDGVALARGSASESDIRSRWSVLLAAMLTADPELLPEVAAMAAAPVPGTTISVGSQHNHGSGTFIGGNFYAGSQPSAFGNL